MINISELARGPRIAKEELPAKEEVQQTIRELIQDIRGELTSESQGDPSDAIRRENKLFTG